MAVELKYGFGSEVFANLVTETAYAAAFTNARLALFSVVVAVCM